FEDLKRRRKAFKARRECLLASPPVTRRTACSEVPAQTAKQSLTTPPRTRKIVGSEELAWTAADSPENLSVRRPRAPVETDAAREHGLPSYYQKSRREREPADNRNAYYELLRRPEQYETRVRNGNSDYRLPDPIKMAQVPNWDFINPRFVENRGGAWTFKKRSNVEEFNRPDYENRRMRY
ncbi:unnamed protein product, partial [Gongylonema pulchrum]|uniref:HYLS1_C domain-containing protein n=1 Tax=Gongylonema pulchrum TaxID=637853 RepID=A0A183DM52_9BILA